MRRFPTRRLALASVALFLVGACARSVERPRVAAAPAPTSSRASSHHAGARTASQEEALSAVARIHGGAGPWAVAGYRMGLFALKALGLPPGSFDLNVVHHTPREVRYSCIADGAAAATGASVGKLNLALEAAPASDLRTVYQRRSTGQTLTLRLTPAFMARFRDVPRDHLAEAGREVLVLRDAEIFEAAP